jgi:hypothetical protein
MLKDFDHEIIDQLVHGVSIYTAQEHKNLANRAKDIQAELPQESIDKDWLVELLSDDHYFLDEAQKLSHELAIVALYKKIEITTKRAVVAAYPDIPSKSLFKINELKKELKKKGVDIKSLPHYKAMDETRCLNNDIKHNGVVGKELSEYPSWKKGNVLSNLDVAYRRLAPLCCLYMGEMVGILIQERRKSISA